MEKWCSKPRSWSAWIWIVLLGHFTPWLCKQARIHESILNKLMTRSRTYASKFGCICRHYYSVVVLVSHGWKWINGMIYDCSGNGGIFGEPSRGLKLSENHLVDKRFQSETWRITCKEALDFNTALGGAGQFNWRHQSPPGNAIRCH